VRHYWQPKIDSYIPESFAGNTERVSQPYEYTPPISDYVGNQNYATEGEEIKVDITGFGKLTVGEIRKKITDILNDLILAADSDNINDAEKLEHKLFAAPELNNLIKQYVKHIKLLKAKVS